LFHKFHDFFAPFLSLSILPFFSKIKKPKDRKRNNIRLNPFN